jgi:hypothetical protein
MCASRRAGIASAATDGNSPSPATNIGDDNPSSKDHPALLAGDLTRPSG